MITHDELLQTLNYSPSTGEFIWLKTSGNGYKGNVAGSKDSNDYVYIGINGVKYLASRLAWFYVYGKWPEKTIDHRDRNPSNNKWDNLRLAEYSQNNMNRVYESRKLPKWVYKHGKKYKAQVKIDGKAINLGSYETPEQAHEVAFKKAKEVFGEFVRCS